MSNLQWKIGDVTVTRVVEHSAVLPINGFFPNATTSRWRSTPIG